MCVAGGRRCPGSGTPSAKQRARRKANTAYRKAVAEAIENTTGDAELARRVKQAPLTDVADVVTAAGLDGEAIAKKCGTATYKDKDGHLTTVDVEPAGTIRRTPITDDTRALLADVCDEVGVYEPGPFADAVAAGDREAQEQLRAQVDEHVAKRLDLFDEEDLSHLSQERLIRRLDQLADLDNYSQKNAGRSLDPDTEVKVATLAERYENALNGQGGGTKGSADTANDEHPRADQLDKWAESTLNAGVSEDGSQSERGAYAAAQYLYQHDHTAQQGLDKDERDEYADDAVEWAASVLDDEEGRDDLERSIAENVVSKRKWDQIKDVQPSTLSDTEFEAHTHRFDELNARIEQGKGNALATDSDMTAMAKAIEDDKQRRATPAALRGIRDLYGYGEVTEDNVEDVAYTANEDIENTDLSSMSDEEFEEYYDRMSALDDEIRDAGGELHSFSTVYDEQEYRSDDEDDRYEFYDSYRRTNQVERWAMETVDSTSHVPADTHERGKYQAAKYLQGRNETERFVDTDAVSWAQSVLDDEDDEYGAFEQGIARNVMGKHTLDRLQDADFSTMSEEEKATAREQVTELRDNLEDYPLLDTDYENTRRLGQLFIQLNKN